MGLPQSGRPLPFACVTLFMQHSTSHGRSGPTAYVKLSPLESRILACLCRGGSTNEGIARELQISAGVVSSYLKGMYTGLRKSNRTQLALWAVRRPDALVPDWVPVEDQQQQQQPIEDAA